MWKTWSILWCLWVIQIYRAIQKWRYLERVGGTMGGRGCLQKVMSPHRKNEYRKFLNYSDRHGAKQKPCIENLLGVRGGVLVEAWSKVYSCMYQEVDWWKSGDFECKYFFNVYLLKFWQGKILRNGDKGGIGPLKYFSQWQPV